MYITYPELLQLKEMNQARVIAGDDGLYRLITWYSISEIVDYKTEDYDKKLVFIAGIGMTDYTKDLLKILHYVYNRGATGVVLEIGPYIPEVPISIIKAADSMQFPLLTLPFDTKVSVVTYAMTQLLFFPYQLSTGSKRNNLPAFKTGFFGKYRTVKTCTLLRLQAGKFLLCDPCGIRRKQLGIFSPILAFNYF